MKINSMKAAAHSAYPISDTASFATLPESKMFFDSFLNDCNSMRYNRFKDRVHTSLAHSMRGQAASWYAALTTGSVCTTAGLLKDAAPMMGDITDAVRAQLPGVIHLGADDSQQGAETLIQLGTLPLMITASSDPQETIDMSLFTHVTAMEAGTTAIHLYPANDEEVEVKVIDDEKVDELWNFQKHVIFHDNALVLEPEEECPSENILKVSLDMKCNLEKVTGRKLNFVSFEGDSDATHVVFAPGYIPYEDRKKALNAASKSAKSALITINLISPLPEDEIKAMIPETAESFFVLEAASYGSMYLALEAGLDMEMEWMEWIEGADYEVAKDEEGECFAVTLVDVSKQGAHLITPEPVKMAFDELMGSRLVLSDEGKEGEAVIERLYGCNLGIRHARAVINNFSNMMKELLPAEDQKVIDEYLALRMSNDIVECMPKIEALREMVRKHANEEDLVGQCSREIISMEDRMPKRAMWAAVRVETALNSGLGTLLQTIPEPEDFRYLVLVRPGQEKDAERLEAFAKVAGKVSIFNMNETDDYSVIKDTVHQCDLVSGPSILFVKMQ